MDPAQEEHYVKMALEHPHLLCSEVPAEVLEAAAFSGEEPTAFVKEFLAAGHKEWLSRSLGRRAYFDPERIDRAVMVLWLRACELYTSYVFQKPHPAAGLPFFSDEGLYD